MSLTATLELACGWCGQWWMRWTVELVVHDYRRTPVRDRIKLETAQP